MNLVEFAHQWIASWNSHDMDDILSHYSDDVEIFTPMIKLATGDNNISLKGKEQVSSYWKKALTRMPDLHFHLIDAAEGVNSVALYYNSVMNKRTVEVMFFNEAGKVNKIIAHYT